MILLVFAPSAGAQSSLDRSRALDLESAPRRIDLLMPQTATDGRIGWSVEIPIDPEVYQIVAGDQLLLGIWGEAPVAYPISVTPQGTMIVPKVGPFEVAGRTLAEAGALAARELAPLFPRSRVTLGLTVPGRFRVSVVGMVEAPGVFEATGADRVATLIEAAGGLRDGGSLRSVKITPRASHPELTDRAAASDPSLDPVLDRLAPPGEIDLLDWYVSGATESNPFVRPGWIIEVPALYDAVRVRGPINGRSIFQLRGEEASGARPDESPDLVLEWIEGDRYRDILELVGGVSIHAGRQARVLRAGGDILEIELDAAVDLDRLALPGDVIEIAHAGRWVFVAGAAENPGRFPYYPGYRAQDYVSLAGGPTEIGRNGGWRLIEPNGDTTSGDPMSAVTPGTTIQVTERRSYQLSRLLAPLTSAAALTVSIIALSRR